MALDQSLFISAQVHERTVEMADGQKHVLHFREVPTSVFRAWQIAERSEDLAVQVSAGPRLIAASLCNADGTPALNEKQAADLKPRVANAIGVVVMELCGYDSAAKKD